MKRSMAKPLKINMKKLTHLICGIMITACSNSQQKKELKETVSIDSLQTEHLVLSDDLKTRFEIDSISCGLNFKPGNNYRVEKSEIEKQRTGLSRKYLNLSGEFEQIALLDSLGTVFTSLLLNNIIPHWYGTEWDFNGYTSIPNEGVIACGYFVSTTLKDMGLNVNRYKLAQQGPENEAKSIAINVSEILHFDEENINEKLQNLDQGIYFIGLDNHVGYLYIKDTNAYFIHSNYIEGKVMIENTRFSEAFYSSNYYISTITGNSSLMDKWLKKEELIVVKE